MVASTYKVAHKTHFGILKTAIHLCMYNNNNNNISDDATFTVYSSVSRHDCEFQQRI